MARRKRKNSLRLAGYDYSQSGMYFVTVLSYQRLQLFGHIKNSEMTLSKLGNIIVSCWQQIPKHFQSVELDAFVMMPNHIHGIIVLQDDSEKVTLGHVMNTFKGAVTRQARKSNLDIDLEHPVWHRNFHDHIIRNEADLNRIRQYVQTNPARWEADTFYD